MAGVTNGAQYAIESIQRNVSSDNYVRNKGNNVNVLIDADSVQISADSLQIPTSIIASIRSVGISFPGSAAVTSLFDFAAPVGNTLDFPVGCIVYVDLHDGLGVLASCAVSVQAGNIPNIGSQSAVFSEAGVTAAAFSVVGTALKLAITGKTVASVGTVRLCRTA